MKKVVAFLMSFLMFASVQTSVLAAVDSEDYEEILTSFTQSDESKNVGTLSKVKATQAKTQSDFSDLIEGMVKDDDVDSFYD